jgi:Tfp pilus assembly protein PilO
VLLAAAAAYWFLLLAPKREEAANLATQITEAETQFQAAEATAASYEAARVSYKENYTRVARLGKAVPADDDVRSLLVQLDTTSTKSKVEFQTLDAGGQAAAGDEPASGEAAPPPGAVPFGSAGMSAMPFSFTLNGSYANLSKLFSDVEKFVTVRNQKIDVRGRLMRIESVSLAPGAAGFPHLRAQVNATTYLMPATGVEGAAAPSTSAAGAPVAPSGDATTPQAAIVTAPTGAAR